MPSGILTAEQLVRRRSAIVSFWASPEGRICAARIGEKIRGTVRSEETRKKISKGISALSLKRNPSLEAREKMSAKRRLRWHSDPEYAQRMFRAIHRKPTAPELELDNLLQSLCPGDWKYVGDGSFVLGGKCPDFVNTNGGKAVIELFGNYWHEGDDPQEWVEHYKKFGYACLVIWERELRDSDLPSRLLSFSRGVKDG